MKNILKFSLITSGILICTSVFSQNDIKKEAANTAEKLESPKPAESKPSVQADKQDPIKTPAAPGNSSSTSKTDSKPVDKTVDTSKEGASKMAISQQGVAKKNKNKKAAAATKATPTPKP